MKRVPRPSQCAKETFQTTISRVREKDLKVRLTSIEDRIYAAAQDYAALAPVPNLHTIATMAMVGGVSKDELIKNYDIRFAKKSSPGHDIYDGIKSLPDGAICPYCNHRDISTLDHFLPKAHFPVFAVAPDNLIGACSDCNKKKGDKRSTSLAQTFLHPYFEDISNIQWLYAEVIQSPMVSVRFYVLPPHEWNADLSQRTMYQFETLCLASLYAKQAAREMNDIREGLKIHFNNNGPEKVFRELLHQWNSRRKNQINSWQTALYEALKNSEWYWQGGFDF